MTTPTPIPDSCTICRRRPLSLAVGSAKDPKWLCAECVQLVGEIRKLKNLDAYEEIAVGDSVTCIGEWLGDIDKTELADFTEEEQRYLVELTVKSFGDSLRRQIREGGAPF